jgi:hypothetical protein
MEEKKINLSINDGDAFFAHEASINFNPTQFMLDFKSVTPRVDARSQEGSVISLKHNVIMLEPYHMKKLHELMGQLMKKYEEEFGKISKPKAIEAFEKKHKQLSTRVDKTQGPSYFG